MPTTDKVIAALAALLVFLGLGFALYIEHNRAEAATEKVESLTASLVASQSALTAYTEATKQTLARAATNQKKVSNALAANPVARDTPVPDDVFDSLYGNRPRAAVAKPASGVSGASAPD
jgi:uncharacterized protein HemX